MGCFLWVNGWQANCLTSDNMKNTNSCNQFDSVMEKIVGQAEAERRREQAAEQRHQEISKIKTIVGALLVAGVIGFAVTHMSELQSIVNAQLAKSHNSSLLDSVTGGKIDTIQQTAQKQDAEVNEITDTTSGNKFAKIEQAAQKRDAILNEITK